MLRAKAPSGTAVVASLALAASLLTPALAGPDAPAAVLSAFQPLDVDRGASGLGLALRRLGVTGRILYVTAHPDDEHNGMLVRLSRGLGLRTALLSVTRGEGGQNAIGPELFEALGVLRTGELLATHRYDGAEQYFGRAYEFGYSFSVAESFTKWGRDETLGDVVRVVRGFRPDVILTLPLERRMGGAHHNAVAQLARDAFRAAADPVRFPEQLAAGLRPWQARKLYQGGVGGSDQGADASLRVPTGVYDPLLGMTWQQLGSRARAMHRCQGAGQLGADPAPAEAVFSLVDAEPAVGAVESDILDGVDTKLAGLVRFSPAPGTLAAALAALEARLATARAAFDPQSPEAAVPTLAEALAAVRSLRAGLDAAVADPLARAEIEERLRDEQADVEAALALAHGLVLEARADDGLVTPGQALSVAVGLFNNARRGLELQQLDVALPAGWRVERQEGEAGLIPGGGSRRGRFAVIVAKDARPSQPFWRRAAGRDRYELTEPAFETLPWSPPPLVAHARCRIAGVETTLRTPVVWRYEGPFVGGERRHELQVVPELSVRLAPEVTAVAIHAPQRTLDVRAYVRSLSRGAGPAEVRLEAPAGWSVEPATTALRFALEGELAVARFQVRPPRALAAATFALNAVATRGGREQREFVEAVDYDHVERRQLLRPAETRVVALDVRTLPEAAVGYVMGSGDALAEAIRQLGVPVTLLSADDLAFASLARFTTIVTGIRAYETREDLRAAQGRLLRWVEEGGHLVVQYNRAAFNRVAPGAPPVPEAEAVSPYAPYPAAVTSERISDETAPLRPLAAGHRLLTTPNRLGDADWEGWVQERGIQLFAARDPRYLELLAAADPFPENPGEKRGLLVEASMGKGTWTYVGLVLFRQVPAGVPGGWRLLANLVSRPPGR